MSFLLWSTDLRVASLGVRSFLASLLRALSLCALGVDDLGLLPEGVAPSWVSYNVAFYTYPRNAAV